MVDSELDLLERLYATQDVRVFNALRELRLELRIANRAFGEMYGQLYPDKPPIYAHIKSK